MQQSKVSLHNHLGRNGKNPGFDRTIDLIYNALGSKAVFGIGNCNDFRYDEFITQKGNFEKVFIGENLDENIAVYIPNKEIMLIRGQEVFSDKGHFLVFGYNYNIGSKTLDDALYQAVDNNAILGTDHRYYLGGLGKFLEENPKYEGYWDFDEVYNGTSEIGKWHIGPKNSNERAIDNYKNKIQGKTFTNPINGKQHKIGAVAFGDTHQLTRCRRKILGYSYTNLELDFMQDKEIASKINPNKLIDELREKLQHSILENCVMHPNKIDALFHVFNMTVVNKVEKLWMR